MSGLVPEGFLALGVRKVRGDRDAVRRSVHDLAACELAPRQAHARRGKPEARGEPVVEALQADLVVRFLERKEGVHGLRLTDRGGTMIRKLAGLAVAALFACAAAGAEEKGRMVSYPSGSESVSGYLAAPEGGQKKPALVVIQEWWGLNDFVKAKADGFTGRGYVALAPDLYRGKATDDPDVAHQLMRGLPEDRAIRDLQAAVAYLRSRPDVDTKRIAAVGWCMGGGYSLKLALAEPGLAGAVIYYGSLVTDEAKIAGLKVPLLGNFGGKDQGIPPESVREFERKAKAHGKSVDFRIYTEAGHGFASSKDPKVFRAEDAKDADARADAFLARVLGAVKR
jgi:carboxymethylenebutenolidase